MAAGRRWRIRIDNNAKKARTSAILRLPSHMLEGIKNAANKRDVPYQSLIKVWLQEKLEEA